MQKTQKRSVLVLLAMVLVFSLISLPAFAQASASAGTLEELTGALEQGGTIVLTGEIEVTQTLTISVEDNGRGLPPELMGPYTGPPETSGRGHLGLYNVDTILKKHYGERYGLYLDNNPAGSGARVRARLPLRRREEEEC